ncbi:hypothetical protein GUJ93_ZPchr0003g16629 [Zizania palustris]|uniref:Protein TIFY n=1 Tax=Zizania palustris TaxID=103762 RepID=A0A8J5S307_ZIZPA|nr:hypothetical protein GUJ93_ZPchr0003g16629 [Zizania palustris]
MHTAAAAAISPAMQQLRDGEEGGRVVEEMSRFPATRGLRPPWTSEHQQQQGGAPFWPPTAAESMQETDARTMQLFPPRTDDDVSPTSSTSTQERRRLAAQTTTAPLIIVYGGQVFVFENYTAEEAEELIQRTQLLANKGNVLAPAPPMPQAQTMAPPAIASGLPGMPIARKASLQRFLQKRRQYK